MKLLSWVAGLAPLGVQMDILAHELSPQMTVSLHLAAAPLVLTDDHVGKDLIGIVDRVWVETAGDPALLMAAGRVEADESVLEEMRSGARVPGFSLDAMVIETGQGGRQVITSAALTSVTAQPSGMSVWADIGRFEFRSVNARECKCAEGPGCVHRSVPEQRLAEAIFGRKDEGTS